MTDIVCTTELEAVNAILGTIGEAPINTLQNLALTDATLAYKLLSQVSREVQTRGWAFNTDSEYPITPDASGNINVPTNAIEMGVAESLKSRLDLVWRQQKMWDRTNFTFNLPAQYPSLVFKFNIKWVFTFEDCPEAFRRYVTICAGRMFLDRTVGNADMHGFSAADEEMALTVLKTSEGDSEGFNILTGSSDVYGTLDRWSTNPYATTSILGN